MNEVIVLKNESDKEKLKKYLLECLFDLKTGDNYTYKLGDVVITIYKSGKVLFQGKSSYKWYVEVKNLLEYSEAITENDLDPLIKTVFPRIGSDESGKGDFFGPLVTVAFLIENDKQVIELEKIGVRDSKKVSDNRIKIISQQIQEIGNFDKILITPIKYNELYDKIKNLNSLLAWSHSKAIENIVKSNEVKMIVIDKFAGMDFISNFVLKKSSNNKAELVLIQNAEREIAVAAASILARSFYLQWLELFQNKLGIELPKGANENVINTALKIAELKGLDFLKEISKMHFSTYNTIKTKLKNL
ncbi:ribonuclease HIII [Ruminiclostridium papyrosolvens DSM 2782]|uniref:Ribonuclease n=1 Tax=Ruminiclostridium papyrosolvens DSM 2782 TaxID=588581 RepID=F1TFM3_9FIRM|nr:ribonuclease HIII [Ruminiclostridium papyrosolvens]EGD46755.1 ribonuclease HIII [Ruminiclostridium papyrosolvens DSM 2782]WES34904.1 ribonuclease HIII [Ruminiclostridium papyrosolvens DSM 2782]